LLNRSKFLSNVSTGAFFARRHFAGYFAIASGSLHRTLFASSSSPFVPSPSRLKFSTSPNKKPFFFPRATTAAPRRVVVVVTLDEHDATLHAHRVIMIDRSTPRRRALV
jgi:hypothetical protein